MAENSGAKATTLIRQMLLLMTVVHALISCSRNNTSDSPSKGEAYQSFTDNGAWCWFSDPRAIYYEGKHKRT